jgi:hypothetical protein
MCRQRLAGILRRSVASNRESCARTRCTASDTPSTGRFEQADQADAALQREQERQKPLPRASAVSSRARIRLFIGEVPCCATPRRRRTAATTASSSAALSLASVTQ